jgi:hypothetical protein
VPEFAAMLGTDRHRTGCQVLAALGPAASAAQVRLAPYAVRDDFDAAAAAWALFRVTGDPQPFLDTPHAWGGRSGIAAVARRLADFGPLAVGHRDRVELVLQDNRASWRSWDGVELGA